MHRSQVNLDQKLRITETGVKRSYGFAKCLHYCLPNATYEGFTGTPFDATLDVFGEVVDSYTMTESVVDEITAPIVYEGRAAKVILDNRKLEEIEKLLRSMRRGWSHRLRHRSPRSNWQLLKRAIEDFKKVNKIKGVYFTKQFQALVNKYNERDEKDVLRSEVLVGFSEEMIELIHALQKEKKSFGEMGIDLEEKSFYDILKSLAHKYDFEYPEDKLIKLAKEVKAVVDDKTKYTDWNQRADIKAELKVDLIILLAENDYPPVDRDEVYKEIFEQAENFKKHWN